MAELISELTKIFLGILMSGAIDIVQVASDIKSRLKDLEKMMAKIEVSLLDPETLQLNDAQIEMLKQLSCTVERMLHFQYDRESRAKRRKIMSNSNLAQKVLFYVSSSNPIVHAFKDATQFTSIWMNLGSLARQRDEVSKLLSILARPHGPRNSEFVIESGPYVTSEDVIGRDGDRDEIARILDSPDNFSVLPITGIGGIGKTTLAQYVFSNEGVKRNFDIMLWVCVGQVFNAKEVIRKMVAFATGDQNLYSCEMAELQNFFLPLIRDKRCLVVLDNVLDHMNLGLHWRELMKSFGFGGPRSRFIITTRSQSVARTMSNTSPYKLDGLDAQDSWHMFQKVACTQQLQPELEQIGRQIAELCGSVPLVIQVIGSLLREKPTTVVEWSNFRDDLASRSCERESSIMQVLKLSYDQLPSGGLKRCFILFSLFPKGFNFVTEDLIYFWRALGFVDTNEIAEEYLLCLVNRGLLIEYYYQIERHNWIRMHDVIHDLAISLGKSKYKLNEYGRCDIDEETRHVCIKSPSYSMVILSSFFQIKEQIKVPLSSFFQLHSLLLWNKHANDAVYVTAEVLSKELPKFERLRVLTLPHIHLKEVPSRIGKLTHLRYLDLSHNSFTELPKSFTQLVNLLYLKLVWCTKLKKLPSDLGKLVDLEYLNLSYCSSLEELPRSINKLEKLRHLQLEGCWSLKHMPVGIGKLTNLRTLDYYVVDAQSCEDEEVGRLPELASLNHLQGRLEILVRNWRPLPSEAGGPNLQAKDKLQHLDLCFQKRTDAEREVLEECRPHPNLTSLGVYGYKGQGPPSWFDDTECVRNLKELCIGGWERVSCWGSLGRIPLLETLDISRCWSMEYIEESSNVDPIMNPNPTASSSFFPTLRTLQFSHIPNWKWKGCGRVHSGSAFPKLEYLSFRGVGLEVVPEEFQGLPLLKHLKFMKCTKLKEIPEWISTLTSLQKLEIDGFPKLMSLPKQIVNLTNLSILNIIKCPILEERFQRQIGKDWPLIHHIPRITFL